MKKMLAAAVAFSLLAGSAMSADLPKRHVAPVAPMTTTVDPNAVTGFYLGAGGGYAFNSNRYDVNVSGGYDLGYVRLEADYDYLGKRNADAVHALTGNALFEYSFTNGFTPYVLVGAGVTFDSFADRVAVYNVGGGLRYSLTRNLDLDARYRYVDTIEKTKGSGEHIATIGVNYRF